MIDDKRAEEIQEKVDEYLKFGPDYVAVALSISHKLPQWTSDMLADRAERIERERVKNNYIKGIIDILKPLEGLTYDEESESAIKTALYGLRLALQREDKDE